MFELLLMFVFLPTILWLATGEGKHKLNRFTIQTLEEIVDSLPEENKSKE